MTNILLLPFGYRHMTKTEIEFIYNIYDNTHTFVHMCYMYDVCIII